MKILNLLLATLFCQSLLAKELLMYTARNEDLIKPLIEKYEAKTGVKVKFITGEAGPLLTRLLAEKEKTSADILMTVDAGNLWQAKEQNVFTKIDSKILDEKVPSYLRDEQKQWFGLSVRARTIFYNPKLVKETELSSYEDLANANWKNKLCLRTSKKVYNQSLVAMMLEHNGEAKTKKMLSQWVENLAQPVFANDTVLLEAIASGDCAVGIANTYYFGRLLKKNPNLNVKLYWPNQKSTGVHVNISGAGVLKYSKNKEEAQKFLEWLVSEEAQAIISDINMEYPVLSSAKLPNIVKAWGEYKPDTLNLNIAGKNQAKAVRLMNETSYK